LKGFDMKKMERMKKVIFELVDGAGQMYYSEIMEKTGFDIVNACRELMKDGKVEFANISGLSSSVFRDEMKLHYTQEKPTKAGWYWVRQKGYTRGEALEVHSKNGFLYFDYCGTAYSVNEENAKLFEFSDRPILECE